MPKRTPKPTYEELRAELESAVELMRRLASNIDGQVGGWLRIQLRNHADRSEQLIERAKKEEE